MSGRVGRPSGGGRTPTPNPFTATSATAELIAELGQPEIESDGGTELLIWEHDRCGDGIMNARLSGRELQGGETAMGQVHSQRSLIAALGLKPRLIVVTVHNRGRRRFEDRPDFRLAREAVELGWCRWFSWRGPDRIAREILPAELYYDFVRESGTELYLSALGRKVDWKLDRVYLRSLNVVNAEEAIAIAERTQDAIRRYYPAERRGWPGSKRFGFRRNWATKYLEVDPEQWEFVQRVHCRYSELEDGHGHGLRGLQTELAACGCEFSVERLRTILRDPIYVTGEFTIRLDGETVSQQPIVLKNPIPPHVFQRNQELLSLRSGRESKTPPGWFCLNGVPVRHARCASLRNSRGLHPRLRGRILFGTVEAYRHSPWVPECCRGYVLDRGMLEPPILGALRSLSRSPALLEAWRARQVALEHGYTSQIVDARRHEILVRRIRNRELQKVQLTKAYLARVDEGEELNERAYWELVGALDAEIEQLRLRVQFARAEPAVGESSNESTLEDALEEILTDEVPSDPARRLQRAALVQAIVTDVELVDDADSIRVKVRTSV